MKKLTQSKSFWFGIITMLLGILEMVADRGLIPMLAQGGIVPPEWEPVLVSGLGFLIITLRLYTAVPIQGGPKDPTQRK